MSIYVKWLPLEDILLENCQFINFERRSTSSFGSVQYTIEYFHTISVKVIENSALSDQVEEEYLEYQSLVKEDISQHIWENAFIQDTSQNDDYRMGKIWGYLRERFPLLSQVALSMLVTPQSNAADEQIFSMIFKNKTEFR